MNFRYSLAALVACSGTFYFGSAFGFAPVDTVNTRTTLDVAAGLGNYSQSITDGSGNQLREYGYTFFDGGSSVQHEFGAGVLIGRIGSFIATRQSPTIAKTNNPGADGLEYLSYSSGYAGAGIGFNQLTFGFVAGVLYFDRPKQDFLPITNSHVQPMGKLWIGSRNGGYFSMSLLYNTALLSQGGMFELGAGTSIGGDSASSEGNPNMSSGWIGLGFGPYSALQGILRLAIQPDDWRAAFLISTNFILGLDPSADQFITLGAHQFGFSLGVRVNMN